MECVHALYRSGSFLLVPKNQVDPQVEMRAHIVTFQSLKEKMQEAKLTKASVTLLKKKKNTTLHGQPKT